MCRLGVAACTASEPRQGAHQASPLLSAAPALRRGGMQAPCRQAGTAPLRRPTVGPGGGHASSEAVAWLARRLSTPQPSPCLACCAPDDAAGQAQVAGEHLEQQGAVPRGTHVQQADGHNHRRALHFDAVDEGTPLLRRSWLRVLRHGRGHMCAACMRYGNAIHRAYTSAPQREPAPAAGCGCRNTAAASDLAEGEAGWVPHAPVRTAPAPASTASRSVPAAAPRLCSLPTAPHQHAPHVPGHHVGQRLEAGQARRAAAAAAGTGHRRACLLPHPRQAAVMPAVHKDNLAPHIGLGHHLGRVGGGMGG